MVDAGPFTGPFCNKLPPITKVPSAKHSAASINTDAESAGCLFRKQQKDIASTLANHLSCRLLSRNHIVMPELQKSLSQLIGHLSLPLITSAPVILLCTASRSIRLWTKSLKAVETCRTVPCFVAVLSRCLAR